MSPIAFLPGFDGDASLRREFVDALSAQHAVRAVSYPPRPLGTIDAYRAHAMAQVPVDWKPVLVAESFGGLVAARWAAIDSRVRAVVLCGAFARDPLGGATRWGAAWPALVKLGPALAAPMARMGRDEKRRAWNVGFSRALAALPDAVVAERLRLIAEEDVGELLHALAVPLLLVQFDDDGVIGPWARAHLERVCHNAGVLRLPGPHFALETQPAQCAHAIAARLREMLPARA
jgi:pimeloyl-ACP methyl ester carboxylesterase